MNREISRWGVGPSILLLTLAYAAIAGLATRLWPDVCSVTAVPRLVFLVAGLVLLLVGIPMLVVSARAATIAFNSDKLATTGIFGLTRNPIYAAWIVFIIPGLVLMSRSWLLFLTPVVAYLIFKARIGRENEYLEGRFGEEHRRYKADVNELVPYPRRR
jgi:protein-S-isoprenylcysteine O-methyltransferase Ste14